ncbi:MULTISPECIES: acyl-CoA thioesterase [unclassified Francisella]|uniref:acyl-CoA thioesterase n=1 Tax=unclassified Francisella TaxID=2610885 RepID=UPI002E31820E|nr:MULTISPECIES: acyl-CoA thioesterase [unclassified Francisella]MED7820206.1 acyl-CoA thioesterase [Francisella sp. 19S2-4]MED7831042.1 acyl-CoA thioesterase [Francisella sp. 19S2-10]
MNEKLEEVNDGELVIRTLALPENTNVNGDIFGGWILSQMDLGGSILAHKIAKGKTVTVAINSMVFIRPVAVGDVVGVYAKLINIGTTSLKLNIRTYVIRKNSYMRELVTQAEFTYVKIDENNKPQKIEQ